MKYTRVNLFAGPSTGKTTASAKIFAELKAARWNVELCREWVKDWAYMKRAVKEFDQVMITGSQLNEEYKYLSNGVEFIITDSPLYLGPIYSEHYYPELMAHNHLESLVDIYEKKFPAINIILDRKDRPYKAEGRFQTHEEAKQLDEIIERKVRQKMRQGILANVHKVDFNDYGKMMEIIMSYQNT